MLAHILLSSILSFSLATTCPFNPAFQTRSLGSFNLTVISDGQVFVDGNFFSVPDAALRRSYRASFRPVFPSLLSLNVLLIDTPFARILVDSGAVNLPEFPFFNEAGKLLRNMRAAGISPESVDAVLITHGHGDHISGINTQQGQRAFPNAKIYVPQAEHDFWTTVPLENFKSAVLTNETVALLQNIYVRNIEPYLDRLVLVPEGGAPFPGIKFISTPGHSPGHVAIRVTSKGERLLITGDSWVTKPDQLENPEWAFFVESDEDQAYATRIRILSGAARRRELVHSFHEVFPGLGYVSENGAAFTWTPAAAQPLGTAVRTQC